MHDKITECCAVAVFDILLRYKETGSWRQAFFQVIPKRKQAHESSSAEANPVQDEDSAEGKQVESVSLLESTDKACASDTKPYSASKLTSNLTVGIQCECKDSRLDSSASVAEKLCNESDTVTVELPGDVIYAAAFQHL